MPKIIFKPETQDGSINFPEPMPASQTIPEWYKKTPVFIEDQKKLAVSREGEYVSNFSVKGCVPFQDALTSGYIFKLPCDVEINVEGGFFSISWVTSRFEPVSTHSEQQAGGIPKSSVHNPFPFKWHTEWIMKTPKGYSTLFTHPLNRYDLPFRSFTGIVDTDTHPIATNFPFQLLDQEEYPYIIPAGTPIVQAIPFKRESWSSSFEKADEVEHSKNLNKLGSKIGRAYRSFWWQKKTYR